MPRPTATPMMPPPAPAARPPAPTSAANLQALLALSGQDRANAFLKGLGAMGPALIAAGAPSTDPGAAQKNIALAGQLRAKATQDDLTRQRAANVQALTTQIALQKAAREQKLADLEIGKSSLIMNTLGRMRGGGLQQPTSVTMPTGGNVAPALASSTLLPTPQATQTTQSAPAVAPPSGMMPALDMVAILAANDQGSAFQRYLDSARNPNDSYNKMTGQLTEKGRTELEKQYRSELKPVLEATQEINRKLRGVRTGIAREDGTGDVAAVNFLIKMIDSGVVTQGELSVQLGGQGIIDRMRTWADNYSEGDILGETLRPRVAALAEALARDTYETYRPQLEKTRAGAIELGLRWDTQIWRGGNEILGNKSRRQTTGNTPGSTLKRKPNQPSINSRVPGLEPVKKG